MKPMLRTILTIAAGAAIVLLADIGPADARSSGALKTTPAKIELRATRLAAVSFRHRVLTHQRAKRAERRVQRARLVSLN